MRRGRVLRGLVALTVLTSFVAACGDDDDDDATPVEEADDGGAAEEVEAQEISITAVDYEFSEAPTEIDAGLVTLDFTNDGEVAHEVALVEMGDTPLAQFLVEFAPVIEEGGPIPAYAQNVAVPGEIGGGDSAEWAFTIAEGTYALFCSLDGDADAPEPAEGEEEEEDAPVDPSKIHFNRGMAQTITVNPGEQGELPEADGTITARDWEFDVDVEADDETINFVSDGPNEVHLGAILEFPEGTTSEEALATFAAFNSEEGPGEDNVAPSDDEFGFTGVFSSGLGNHITPSKQFKSGFTYLIACFISDRAGGPPHALPEEAGGHGMVTTVVVE